MNTEHSSPQRPGDGQTVYASFQLGDEDFALDVRHVQEAVNLPAKITPMPLSPEFVPGVFNLRGAIIPILSMVRLLGRPGEAYQQSAKVVIVQHKGVRLGLLFDNTNRVLRPRGEEQTLFSYADSSTHRVVAGVLKMGGDLVRVLDLDRLVAIENVPHAHSTAGAMDASRAKRAHKRCITFRVGGMLLGFAINGVHEIVPANGIERSPVQEGLCVGLMHIRDDVVPVVRFGALLQTDANAAATADADADAQRVIVLKIGQMHAGLLVDSVEAITAYADEDVMHVPVLTRQRANMFAGCLDLGEAGHVFLLDSQCVMDNDEISRISGQHSSLFATRNNEAQFSHHKAGARQTYLWFDAQHALALPMQGVREIVDCADDLIAMPGAPDFVSGMYNLRGTLVTVVNVRQFYQLGDVLPGEVVERKVVVLEHDNTLLGLQVDRVRSIMHIGAKEKYAIPKLLRNALPAKIRGDVSEVIQANSEHQEVSHLLVLDVTRIFASIGEQEVEAIDA